MTEAIPSNTSSSSIIIININTVPVSVPVPSPPANEKILDGDTQPDGIIIMLISKI